VKILLYYVFKNKRHVNPALKDRVCTCPTGSKLLKHCASSGLNSKLQVKRILKFSFPNFSIIKLLPT
ncbi:MAG: hypothetical protein WCJ33_07960, partial [Pseudomonadota bacterium]